MNSTRCSRLALLAVLVIAVVGPVAAVSVDSSGAPATAQVGQKVTATYTVTDLYTEYDSWTLRGETNLTDVTWTVTTYDQTGAKIGQQTYNKPAFERSVSAKDGVNKLTVKVTGTVPAVKNWSYDPAQSIVVSRLTESQQGGTSSTLQTVTARPYTEDSQSARSAVDDASAAVSQAKASGADTSEAQTLLESAISAYDNGNFQNAERLAGQAKQKANGSAASKQQTSLLLMAGAGVVVLLGIVGAVWWYLNQRQTYDKLG